MPKLALTKKAPMPIRHQGFTGEKGKTLAHPRASLLKVISGRPCCCGLCHIVRQEGHGRSCSLRVERLLLALSGHRKMSASGYDPKRMKNLGQNFQTFDAEGTHGCAVAV